MSDDREGFLARWSRRKAGIASPVEDRRDVAPPVGPRAAASSAPESALPPTDVVRGDPVLPAEAPPLPTLADVAALTRDSDYTRFMAPGVDGAVRNAAMKKLFSDPRFNVMDGLDVYIDDYSTPDPLPLEMLKQLRQSEMLGLFRDEVAAAAQPAAAVGAQATPDNAATAAASPTVEPPPPADPTSRAEDDPDLRLQPDDGDRRSGAGEGARD